MSIWNSILVRARARLRRCNWHLARGIGDRDAWQCELRFRKAQICHCRLAIEREWVPCRSVLQTWRSAVAAFATGDLPRAHRMQDQLDLQLFARAADRAGYVPPTAAGPDY